MTYVLGPNSTARPNAAQRTRLRNLTKLLSVKAPTPKTAPFYHLLDPNTNPIHATHNEGP